MSRPIRRSVDVSSVAPSASRVVAQSGDWSSRAMPHVAAEPREIDACLYIFAFSKHLRFVTMGEALTAL